MSPYFIAALALSCYASLGVLAKKVQLDIPPFSFIAVTMVFLSIYGFIASFSSEKTFSFSSISMNLWLYLAFFAFVNFVGFALYLNAISKIPVVEYQIIALITPIVGGILGYLVLSEALTVRYFVGLAIIGIGLYVALKK